MVRELLDRETDSGEESGTVTRSLGRTMTFVFLRRENFGVVPEYVLKIVLKRKDKYPLYGQVWVDASTFPYPANSMEYPPRAPLVLDHLPFTSQCNLRN